MTTSTTTRAGLGGVARIDVFHRNPSLQSLVLDKALELGKGPTMEVGPLGLALLGSLSDVGQLLHDDNISCLEATHDGFTDAVIQVAHNASLLAPKAFDETPCAPTPFGKQLATQLAVVPPDVHRLFATELEAVRGHGQINHANVYPDPFTLVGLRQWIDLSLDDNVQVECLGLLIIDEIRRAIDCPVIQEGTLEVSQHHRDFDATLDGGDGGPVILGDGERPGIESDGCVGAKAARRMAIALPSLVSFCNLISGSAGQLGREVKLLSGAIVAKMVERNFVMQATMLMGYLGNVVTGVAELTDRLKHRFSLLNPRIQLAPHGLRQLQHSSFIITHIRRVVKGSRPCGCSSLRRDRRVSATEISR